MLNGVGLNARGPVIPGTGRVILVDTGAAGAGAADGDGGSAEAGVV
jgi:hypothetical protein